MSAVVVCPKCRSTLSSHLLTLLVRLPKPPLTPNTPMTLLTLQTLPTLRWTYHRPSLCPFPLLVLCRVEATRTTSSTHPRSGTRSRSHKPRICTSLTHPCVLPSLNSSLRTLPHTQLHLLLTLAQVLALHQLATRRTKKSPSFPPSCTTPPSAQVPALTPMRMQRREQGLKELEMAALVEAVATTVVGLQRVVLKMLFLGKSSRVRTKPLLCCQWALQERTRV